MVYSEYEFFELSSSGDRLDELKQRQRQVREALQVAPDHPALLHEALEIQRKIHEIVGD